MGIIRARLALDMWCWTWEIRRPASLAVSKIRLASHWSSGFNNSDMRYACAAIAALTTPCVATWYSSLLIDAGITRRISILSIKALASNKFCEVKYFLCRANLVSFESPLVKMDDHVFDINSWTGEPVAESSGSTPSKSILKAMTSWSEAGVAKITERFSGKNWAISSVSLLWTVSEIISGTKTKIM